MRVSTDLLDNKATESVELSWLERFNGFGFRIDGKTGWAECAPFAGFTPVSDSINHLSEAVVAIAHAHNLEIRSDQVAVDGLDAHFTAEEE